MTAPSIAVLTLARGRHDHLFAQVRALALGATVPDLYVVAAMDDPRIGSVVERASVPAPPAREVRVVSVPAVGGGLPLARARNIAAATAMAAGAGLLLFLDVDCIPSARLVQRYAEAAALLADRPDDRHPPAAIAGTVRYLPARLDVPGHSTRRELEAAVPHPARPAPAPDQMVLADNPLLFWSLSFAMTTQHWSTVGGFDQSYLGYGGEDTDFAMRLAAEGGRLYWIGDATCYHQHHEVEDPPLRHLQDIVLNSNRFRARWGFFPMEGWLSAFAERGLIRQIGSPPMWHLTEAGRTAVRIG